MRTSTRVSGTDAMADHAETLASRSTQADVARQAVAVTPLLHAIWRFCRRKPHVALGGAIVLVMIVMADFAPHIAHYTYDETIRGARLQPPSAQFWRGSVKLGRAIWSRVVYGARVWATIGLGAFILAESALSFLGFGVPPPYPSWGGMRSGSGRSFFSQAPWIAIYPGLAISLAVFGFNMLGDALRDVLDPRLRGAGGRMR